MKKNTAERILSGLLAMIIVLTCGVVRAKADNDEISEMKVITGKDSYEYDIVCAGKEAVVTERGTLQLALISKADGEPVTKGILWDSSKPDIAGISSTGLLTGKKTGTVTVSCLALDGRTVYAAADIRVAIGVSGITLDAESISLLTGVPGKNDTVAVTATVLPENAYFKGVTWHSENEDVAAVDAKGNIKAVSAGKTRMIAESEDPG